MFTGIVEEMGQVQRAQALGRGFQLTVKASTVLGGTQLGDSIAVNGVCLTVTDLQKTAFSVGVAPETLKKTNISLLKTGDWVNLERAVLPTTRLGGHFVQGHVDAMATVKRIQPDQDALVYTLEPPKTLLKYIVPKGFICLDGVSLTIVDVTSQNFSIMLITHTQDHVTLPRKKTGDKINVEVDILGKYIEKLCSWGREEGAGMSRAFLREHGYG